MPDGQTVNVVSYSDARSIAYDAASAAAQNASARSDSELVAVADNAALKASQSVASQVEGVTDEKLQKVAQDASEQALKGMQDTLDAQVKKVDSVLDAQLQEIESRSTSVESVSVTLDDAQWTYIQQSLQVQNTCAVLTMLLVSCVFGAVVVRYFVTGWRR